VILVTVGTHPQGFDRLVQPMDELAAELEEEVIIQYGSSSYEPRHAEGFRFTDSQQMEALTQQARVVVTHAAAGAIIVALQCKKRLVLAPRLKRYGEHFDDHQLQLAQVLHDQCRAVAVLEPSTLTLTEAFRQVERIVFTKPDASGLVAALQAHLAGWENEVGR
jgi:beta-1,4-N-acetylglucosaminyltransferase